MPEEKEAHPVTLTDQNFEDEVHKFSGVVLVDFWADWCSPCHIMAPRIIELAQKYAGNEKVKIAKLDIETANEIAESHRILSIPTFMIFSGGKQVDFGIGVQPTTELDKKIQKALLDLS